MCSVAPATSSESRKAPCAHGLSLGDLLMRLYCTSTVYIRAQPACTCPDGAKGNHCKHIVRGRELGDATLLSRR